MWKLIDSIYGSHLGLIAVETVKSYSLTPNSAFSADAFPPDSIAEQDFSPNYSRKSMPIAARRQSQLACRENPVNYSSGLPGLGWLHSTRNLDFCLLALCSCLMAILCHQVIVIPGSSTASSMASSASMSRSAQLDFLFKAGLFTGKSEQEPEAEDAN